LRCAISSRKNVENLRMRVEDEISGRVFEWSSGGREQNIGLNAYKNIRV
jgi:hypothetical protein